MLYLLLNVILEYLYSVIVELTDSYKKDKEEEKKRKKNEQDINMVMTLQRSTDAGEQPPSSNGNDEVTTTTAAVAITTPNKPAVASGTGTTAIGADNPPTGKYFTLSILIPGMFLKWSATGNFK